MAGTMNTLGDLTNHLYTCAAHARWRTSRGDAMTACTDDERRLVAERLRGLDYSDLQESLICAHLDALGIKGYEDWVGIAHRLADLIDPDTTTDTTKTPTDTTKCDRDALLELADEMQGELDECADDHEIVGKLQYRIDRIREALGVEQ